MPSKRPVAEGNTTYDLGGALKTKPSDECIMEKVEGGQDSAP